MAFNFEQVGQEIIDPFVFFWNSAIENIPGVIGALIIMSLGYFVGVIVGFAVSKSVSRLKVDEWLEKMKRADALGGLTISKIGARLVKWWIFIAFLVPAANIINLPDLSKLLITLAEWVPHLIAAIVIMIGGLIVADYFADTAAEAKKMKGIRHISSLLRILVIIYFADIALREIGINVTLAENTILLLIGGIVLALALAIGIGFGLGLRDHAKSIIADLRI